MSSPSRPSPYYSLKEKKNIVWSKRIKKGRENWRSERWEEGDRDGENRWMGDKQDKGKEVERTTRLALRSDIQWRHMEGAMTSHRRIIQNR